MNERELKPCPFCGGPAKECAPSITEQPICCDDPACFMSNVYVDAREWNTRAALPEQGTPEARLAGVVEIAMKYCGYQGIEAHSPETAIIRELEKRRALPEQPLAKQWREAQQQANEQAKRMDAEGKEYNCGFADGMAEAYAGCSSDLDAQHDQDREQLKATEKELHELADHLRMANIFEFDKHVLDMADRIRKHLEGDSDAV